MVSTYMAMFYSMGWNINQIEIIFRRDGRVVDSSGLENRYSVRNKELSRVRIPLSPFARRIDLFLYFIGFARLSIIKGNGSARLDSRAKIEKKSR